MKLEVIITQVNHYNMEGNKGVSARVVGGFEQTNNKFGLTISEASVPNTDELSYLLEHATLLPAKFKTTISIGSAKKGNGKEVSAVNLSDLEFVNSVEFTDKKVPVKA